MGFGPFDPFSYRDELLLDIEDLLSFLKQLRTQLNVGDLGGMSDEELEYEYQRINRYVHERMRRKPRPRASTDPESTNRGLAGAYYSPQSGLHISERSG